MRQRVQEEKMFEKNNSLTILTIDMSEAKKSIIYPNIDMVKTGLLLRRMIEGAGYTPKMIQRYLHLSCPQPIYRWYQGRILPSVNHLLMLSELLNVHMEDLIVKKQSKEIMLTIDSDNVQKNIAHLIAYYEK